MGALIILHGLFVLNCHTAAKNCDVMVVQAMPHLYKVGLNADLVDIPASTKLKVSLESTPMMGAPDPNNDLYKRGLVLNSSRVKALRSAAVMVIQIPLPDKIYGANGVLFKKADVADNIDAIHPSAADVVVNETLLLHYTTGRPFALLDHGKVVQVSQLAGKIDSHPVHAMAFYSWPRQCVGTPAHTDALNDLLTFDNGPVTLHLSGKTAIKRVDLDSTLKDYELVQTALRPPCVGWEPPRVGFVTADETGCGDVVIIDGN